MDLVSSRTEGEDELDNIEIKERWMCKMKVYAQYRRSFFYKVQFEFAILKTEIR